MLLIVAHHYVVNSGLMTPVVANLLSAHSVFLLLFGMWGKIGINCFVLITGYFMCKSQFSWQKFAKLLFQVMFYKITFYLIFVFTGYLEFTMLGCVRALLPVTAVEFNFVGCFLLFYLMIPYLNILISSMNRQTHTSLLLLLLFIYTVLGTTAIIPVRMNYVTWFCVLYLLSSYIRLYGLQWRGKDICCWGRLTLFSVILSMLSVLTIAGLYTAIPMLQNRYGGHLVFWMVADSNHILAVVTAVCSFMYFKDLKIRQSRFINTVAASTFGVLLIHANSDAMRQWLWRDTLDNVGQYGAPTLYLHAVASIVIIFVLCIIIDYLRIRYIEKRIFYTKKK